MFGGHGYIREWGMEQFVRDARIAQIYEGTNGVQAMDLVGRKLAKDGGRGVRALFELIGRDIAEAKAAGDPAGVAEPLEKARRPSSGARPCGWRRTAWPIPTMPAPAPMPICS